MSILIMNTLELLDKDIIYIDPNVITDTNLSNKSFIIYCYLHGLTSYANNSVIANSLNISLRTVYRAFAELINLGYLYKTADIIFLGSTEQTAYSLYLDHTKKEMD